MKKLLSLLLLLALLTACAAPVQEPVADSIPATSPEISPEPLTTPETEPESESESTPQLDEAAPDAMKLLLEGKTCQYITDEAVPQEDIETILQAGLNAPSAMNYQPWHFTVVTDTQLLKDLGDEVLKVREYGSYVNRFNLWNTSVAIVISKTDLLPTDGFDCGLACEAMSLTAQLLGYGAKILAHPNLVLNGDNQEHYKEVFAIPQDHTAIAVLVIGVPDTDHPDAVTSASTRDKWEDHVSYLN